jgi:hypothetical protein
MNNKIALITGGTSGIGLSLAKIFAKNKYDLVITARKQDELDKASQILKEAFGVQVFAVAQDLSKPEAPEQLFNWCQTQNLKIDVLVNNAGFGAYGRFDEVPLERQLNIVDLNIRSLTNLTGLFLPGMIGKGSGKILNVASTAAFQPGPLMTTYYASKAYVLSFSLALREELKNKNIGVTALCPGPTRTNFQNIESDFGKTRLLKHSGLMTADKVAAIAYRALMNNKAYVVTGLSNKLLAFVAQVSPRTLAAAVSHWTLKRPS